ncbi:MAG: type II toxin-antitoxin system RelE/ParE family toxin [Bryobacteraceae bacterium]|jgi:plasmid stabilization system protein ParE
MTAEQGFRLHPLAAQDITEIWEYIAEDNPLAARRVREEILSRIRAVVPFPNQGHKRPDLTSRPLRFILVREYPIAYTHGRRSPRVMAEAPLGRCN